MRRTRLRLRSIALSSVALCAWTACGGRDVGAGSMRAVDHRAEQPFPEQPFPGSATPPAALSEQAPGEIAPPGAEATAPETETTPARVSLAGGRLLLRAAEYIPPLAEETDASGPGVFHRCAVRFAVGGRSLDLDLESRDLLDLQVYRAEGPLGALPTSSPTLRAYGQVSRFERQRLVLGEDGSTTVEVTLIPRLALSEDEKRHLLVEFAARLEVGRPPRTTSDWRGSVGDVGWRISLPEGYAVYSDAVLDEGIATEVAVNVLGPAGGPGAKMTFTRHGARPPRGASVGRTLQWGERRLRVRSLGARSWTVDLGCGCGWHCTMEIEGSAAERERLLAALSEAHVLRRFMTEADLPVRADPSATASLTRTVPAGDSIWIREGHGDWGWVEPPGPDTGPSGWVPRRAVAEDCD